MAKKISKGKPPTTVAELAAMGGAARADSLTPQRRKEIAKKAAEVRWKKAEQKGPQSKKVHRED